MGNYQTIHTVTSSRSDSTNANKIMSIQRRINWLETNLAKTLMINEALWEFIRDQHQLSLEDLHNKLYEIDMRDGQLDGKNQRGVSTCPKCNRKVSPRHPACIYCGEVIDNSVFSMT
jgi:hypothetical protein